MKSRSGFVAITGTSIDRELELLELCAAELLVIAELSVDRHTRSEHQALAAEYRLIAGALRSRLTLVGDVLS